MRAKISFDEHRKWLRSSQIARQVSESFGLLKEKISESAFGPSGDFFAGSQYYPEISWGPTVSLMDVPRTRDLYGQDYEKIILARAAFLHGRRYGGIKPVGRMIDKSREIAMSEKPIDLELRFSRAPSLEMQFSQVSQPMGAGAPLKELTLAGNPKIPKIVDSVIEDKMKANDAICELAGHGMDNYYLTTLLSAGILGKQGKKLVPTRWSITAVDDMLAKSMMDGIREFPQINEPMVFSNEYLFNHFEILLMPGNWEFENFEAWAPNTSWGFGSQEYTISEEYEPHGGRSGYAEKQAGGYYAARLGVCEYLSRIRKQARVVSFREIGEGYQIPVGVWEVRENVRHAFLGNPKKFPSNSEAMAHLQTRLRVPMQKYIAQTKVMTQSRLSEFF